MEKLSITLGHIFLVVGGPIVLAMCIAVLVWLGAMLWAGASNRFRDICKAESLIHEYRHERDTYLAVRNQIPLVKDALQADARCIESIAKSGDVDWCEICSRKCSEQTKATHKGKCNDFVWRGRFYF